jgi:hypothetical protein
MTVAIILCSATLVQAKTNSMGIADKQTVTFTAPTVVGGTLLPAGDYNVSHQMQGTEHIMIFKGTGGTKGEAKAKCSLVPLNGKASQSEQRYNENAKNERVLIEMIFRGDTQKHVLIQ